MPLVDLTNDEIVIIRKGLRTRLNDLDEYLRHDKEDGIDIVYWARLIDATQSVLEKLKGFWPDVKDRRAVDPGYLTRTEWGMLETLVLNAHLECVNDPALADRKQRLAKILTAIQYRLGGQKS